MLVLTCMAPGCDQGQGYPYKTPHALCRRQDIAPTSHGKKASPRPAEGSHGLFTMSLPEEIGIKSSAEAATKPATSDVTRHAIRAAKKARQRAAKYGPEKLVLAKTSFKANTDVATSQTKITQAIIDVTPSQAEIT